MQCMRMLPLEPLLQGNGPARTSAGGIQTSLDTLEHQEPHTVQQFRKNLRRYSLIYLRIRVLTSLSLFIPTIETVGISEQHTWGKL